MASVRVLVCGDRRWKDEQAIERELSRFPPETIVIQGDNGNAERMAANIARRLGMNVETHSADWAKYGKSAIPIRNAEMMTEGRPEVVLAFHANIEDSRVTEDMVIRAREAGIKVQIFAV